MTDHDVIIPAHPSWPKVSDPVAKVIEPPVTKKRPHGRTRARTVKRASARAATDEDAT